MEKTLKFHMRGVNEISHIAQDTKRERNTNTIDGIKY